jgi:hypothetical protein
MALDVYFREDILNVLRATYAAGEGPAALVAEMLQDDEFQGVSLDKLLQVYRQGFNTALGAVGLAFGLDARAAAARGHSLAVSPARSTDRGRILPDGRAADWLDSGASSGARSPDLDRIDHLWAAARYDG